MSETQNQDAPQSAENAVFPVAPKTPAAVAEEKSERLVESTLEASHCEVLPLSPIDSASTEATPRTENAGKNNAHRGLRRGNAGRGERGGKPAKQSVGIVENPKNVQETLSGKFVDGYEKDKEFRRARERRENVEFKSEQSRQAPSSQGWCLTDDPAANTASARRHPQSNAGANRGKLIIEPAPIPEQEKDPSFWQKFKAKVLSIFGLNKKKKKYDKNFRGGKNNRKRGKKNYGKNGDFRNGNRGGNSDFRGGNYHRGRHYRGPRSGNSGARPPHNGGNGNPPSAA